MDDVGHSFQHMRYVLSLYGMKVLVITVTESSKHYYAISEEMTMLNESLVVENWTSNQKIDKKV